MMLNLLTAAMSASAVEASKSSTRFEEWRNTHLPSPTPEDSDDWSPYFSDGVGAMGDDDDDLERIWEEFAERGQRCWNGEQWLQDGQWSAKMQWKWSSRKGGLCKITETVCNDGQIEDTPRFSRGSQSECRRKLRALGSDSRSSQVGRMSNDEFEDYDYSDESYMDEPMSESESEHLDYEEQPIEHIFKALTALQSQEANGEFEHGCPLLTCMAAFQHAHGCELGVEFTQEDYDELVEKLPTECLTCEAGAMEYACPPPATESEGVGAMFINWVPFMFSSEWATEVARKMLNDGATGAMSEATGAMSDSLMGKPIDLTWCKLFDPFCFTACCWANK